MNCRHNHSPISCFIPPHILNQIAKSDDVRVRSMAIDSIAISSTARSSREVLRTMPIMAAIPSPSQSKHRLIYDMEGKTYNLPGKLARSEGEGRHDDESVNNIYCFLGIAYDCYKQLFARNSLDDNGMKLIASVHFGDDIDNAVWNGRQTYFGDGNKFLDFTKSLEVVVHELTHGVIMYTANLDYHDEPGALNESFADVMGAVIEQKHRGEHVKEASWLIGDELIGPDLQAKAIRTFKKGPAYENCPILGTDPQTKHYDNIYRGSYDNGGVHLNSGIANHAFYRTALALGGNSWNKAGPIWYRALLTLVSNSCFLDCAQACSSIAGQMFGTNSLEQKAVKKGWKSVGVSP